MLWILDHWWIANMLPFFAINAWFVHAFERDEGPFLPEERTFKWLLYSMGLIIVVGLLITVFAGDISDSLETYSESRRAPLSRAKRSLKQSLLPALWILTRVVLIAVAMAVIVTITTTMLSFRPNQFLVIAEFLFLIIASEAVLYLIRRNRHD